MVDTSRPGAVPDGDHLETGQVLAVAVEPHGDPVGLLGKVGAGEGARPTGYRPLKLPL